MKRSAWPGARASAAPWAALVLLAGGLGGCMSTATYGTGESPELAIFREMTGGIPLVGAAKKKEAIEYQPRAPLVLPPSAGQLPATVETAALANPQWPQEPEKASGTRFGDDQPRDDISPEEYRRLKPLAGLNRGNRRIADYERSDMQNAAYDVVNSKKQQETFKAAVADAEGYNRTERRYLTDPPEALRAPAATAPQEFDKIKKKRGGLTGWLLGGG